MAVSTGAALLGGSAISAATSIGGAAISAGGQSKAAEAADEANSENKVLTSQLIAAGTPYLMGKGDQARTDLNTGRTDVYNALVQGLGRTDPLYAEWDNAYNLGAGQYGNALTEYDQKYGQVVSDNKAYTDLGRQGATGYSNLLADPSSITSDPGYLFRLNQGGVALDRSAAAKGQLFSGGSQAAQQEYGQNYASNEYDKALGRYNTAMNQGQQAQGRVDAAGMQTASGKAGIYNSLAGLATQRANAKTGIGQFQAGLYQNAGNMFAGLQKNMADNEQLTGANVTNYWLKVLGRQQEDNSNAAAQKGSAYAGEANAWSQGVGGVGNAINSGLSSYAYDQRSTDLNNYWKSYYGG